MNEAGDPVEMLNPETAIITTVLTVVEEPGTRDPRCRGIMTAAYISPGVFLNSHSVYVLVILVLLLFLVRLLKYFLFLNIPETCTWYIK